MRNSGAGPGAVEHSQFVYRLRRTEVPSIRRLLEQDLKARGVLDFRSGEGANAVRITLSEKRAGRLWVAEIDDRETRRAWPWWMWPLEAPGRRRYGTANCCCERDKICGTRRVFAAVGEPVARGAEISGGSGGAVCEMNFVLLRRPREAGSNEEFPIGKRLPLARDPHGVLLAKRLAGGFSASAPGTECTGSYSPSTESGGAFGEWASSLRLE